ncbi:tRNA-binding protein [Aureliella helgolandensis]|uniref:tRNA-binding protein YgjH n=1 Tax=Aureliella helgolandensis TaxID=2527968 RepID=A0A518G820_9BACT|nr:tRNA-binding protein [Aureliella helgolandensis]QDV24730.1 tRNA-binding protein YgjH [Aureliella helgolandensis]
MEEILWSDFAKVELRVGTVIDAREFPEAHKPAYKITIDFGANLGVKKTSSQVTTLYTPTELIGRQVLAVINFPPKQIGPFMSECLLVGLHRDNGDVVLAIPDQPVPNGTKLC